MLTVGSLFSGCDGMFLGLAAVADCDLAWYAETDKDASALLARHHPGVPNLGDVTRVDWTQVEPVDVLIGGPPCQAVSSAGKQLGSADERWMWPAALHAMTALRPAWTCWENPTRLLTGRDKDDDDASDGDPDGWGVDGPADDPGWFGWILGEVAAAGFDAEWCCLRASDVGAPHRRDRVFLACTPADARSTGTGRDSRSALAPQEPSRRRGPDRADPPGARREAAAAAVALLPTPVARDWKGRDLPSRVGTPSLPTAVTLLPTPRAQNAESRNNKAWLRPLDQPQNLENAVARWGRYHAAVARWEHIFGEPAPTPVDEKGRLNPDLPRWMLGLPPGHLDGLTRTSQLRIAGNSCQPQQAAAAIRHLTRGTP